MSRYPKLREDIVAKQQVMAGEVSYMVKIRDPQKYLRFPVADWDFVCLLDGLTSFEEIAERYSQMHPESPMSPRSVESYVESLKKSDVIERTPAEQSIVILEKLQAERQKRAEQSATQDVFYLTLAHTNPEKFYKAIFPYIRWIWTRQFVIATLLLFTAAASVIISNWHLVREGMLQFWNFHEKSPADIVMLFCILAVVIAIHESAHALTCMNFGGEVTELGFMLIYFMPAFYANVSDAYLFDKKWHKYWVTLAGGYSELILCSFSVFAWWLTQPDAFVHHLAYNIMVFAGVSTIIFNYNPLIKLDGYYLLSDILEMLNLRGSSAAYLVYLIKTRIFGTAAQLPEDLTPRKKRIFLIYGVLSTMYIISIVTVFILFQYRLFNRWFPEFGIFLGFLGGYLILRKRLKKLMVFSRFILLDKRELFQQKAAVRRWALIVGVFLLALLLYPFSHTVTAPVVLEPFRRLPLRAETAGFVAEVLADPAGTLSAGALLVRMRNDELTAQRLQVQGEVERLTGDAATALANGDLATYQARTRERQRAEQELAELRRKEAMLEVRAPFEGQILTTRLQDLVGKHVEPGVLLCEFGSMESMSAVINVSEFDFRELERGQNVVLKVNSYPAEVFRGQVHELGMAALDGYDPAGRSTELIRTVHAAATKAEGTPFSHFDVMVELPNPGERLRSGMSGMAKINPDRHSLAARLIYQVRDVFRSRVWW